MQCHSDDLPGRNEIARLLEERESVHGPHHRTALFEQSMRNIMRNIYSECWRELPPAMCSALDEVVRKMARILSGDHTHEDHWLDIEGAARLGRQAAGSERSHRKWLERQERKKSGGGLNG